MKWIKRHFNAVLCFFLLTLLFVAYFSAGQQAKNKALDTWLGKYSFTEVLPAGPPEDEYQRYGIIEYKITIYKAKGDCYAEIRCEGYQTNVHVLAKASGNQYEAKLFFDTIFPDNMRKKFDENSLLLRLSRESGALFTSWHSLQCETSLQNNCNKGVYFGKTS